MPSRAFPSEARRRLYLLVNGAAPFALLATIGGMLYGKYALTWVGALIVALLMESRVQIGVRLPRTPLLWLHILSSVLFFACLTVLAFVHQNPALILLTWLLLVVGAVPGSMFWYRGVVAALSSQSAVVFSGADSHTE